MRRKSGKYSRWKQNIWYLMREILSLPDLLKVSIPLTPPKRGLATPWAFLYSLYFFGSSCSIMWISLRHLYNIEHGKNWISIEKFILLADALEEDPAHLFHEIVEIYRSSQG